jgi:transcription initiation factor TFIID subunit 7
LKKRFEDALKKLRAELDMKLGHRDDMKEQQRLRDEGIVSQEPSEGAVDGEDDDLFGDEDDMS